MARETNAMPNMLMQLIIACAILLPACANMDLSNPFTSDPLTGGQDATTSILVETPLPYGLQRYSSHGFIATGENGVRNGLETFRGNIDGNAAAVAMFNNLHAAGWDLRMQNRKGDRALYVYQKGGDIAAVNFRPQGILTIMEIWRGPELAKGTALGNLENDEPIPSIAGEEYSPLNGSPEKSGASENWGSPKLEEKEL